MIINDKVKQAYLEIISEGFESEGTEEYRFSQNVYY